IALLLSSYRNSSRSLDTQGTICLTVRGAPAVGASWRGRNHKPVRHLIEKRPSRHIWRVWVSRGEGEGLTAETWRETDMTSRLRIIVTGLIAQYPLGGVTWDYFQYVLGLAQLGHEVYYV